METKFNFNSQVCTDRNQSERLLALGLKPETADMCHIENKHHYNSAECKVEFFISPIDGLERLKENHIPAWSLHRLIEMALRHVLICGISFTFIEDAYEKVIGIIEHQIKEGYFNKEYLQEQSDSRREG